jgi:sugar/nucleoside kinase (ribokinase family)
MSLADKPFTLSENLFKQIKFISPNLSELRKIADSFNASSSIISSSTKDLKIDNVRTSVNDENLDRILRDIADLCQMIGDRIENIVVTAGHLGVVIYRSNGSTDPFFDKNLTYIQPTISSEKNIKKLLRHYPSIRMDNEKILSASGAGDCFCSGFITGMLRHKQESICVSMGLEAARLTLMSTRAVPKTLYNEHHLCCNSPALFNVL